VGGDASRHRATEQESRGRIAERTKCVSRRVKPTVKPFTRTRENPYRTGRYEIGHGVAPCGPVLLPVDRCARAAPDRIAFHPRAGTASRSVFRKCPRERRPW